MTLPRAILATLAALALPAAASADTAPVLKAGRWETTMTFEGNSGMKPPVQKICRTKDVVFDKQSISKMTSNNQIPCSDYTIGSSGGVTTFSTTCQMGDMTMHSSGTVTMDGPDSYTTKVQTHVDGAKMAMPDQRITIVSRFLGPCQPGDIQSPF